MLASAQRAPSLASLGPIRGGVPVPTERPYGLNDQPAMEAEAPATYRTASYGAPRLQPTEMTSVQRLELSRYETAPRLEAPRYEAPAPRTPAPVAAYAPAPYDASRSLVTGRGLY
jgi:hypothetical protein